MRDKIIEVLKKNLEVEYWDTKQSINAVAEEIEKLYENHIKTGIVEGYDKSKFEIFPTWKETKEVSEISEEVFLSMYVENCACSGYPFTFSKFCMNNECEKCHFFIDNSKADIIKWMEEIG